MEGDGPSAQNATALTFYQRWDGKSVIFPPAQGAQRQCSRDKKDAHQ